MYRAVCHEYLSFIDLYNCDSAFSNDIRLDCSQACKVCCIRKCLQKNHFPWYLLRKRQVIKIYQFIKMTLMSY